MYAKIFKSLFYGSLAGKSDPQHVFICLLTHTDRDGHVELPAAAIAALCGLPLERVESALELLEGPDPDSRTEVEDGRRLEKTGSSRWQVVNYEKYRSMRDEDERRRQTREAVARHRVRHGKPDVSRGKPQKAQAEAEAYAEAEESGGVGSDISNGKAEETVQCTEGLPGIGEESVKQWSEGFDWFWEEYPRKVGKEEARKSYNRLRPRTQETYDAVMAGLRWYVKGEWEGREPSKIPHAATWLNQRRWMDAQAIR